VCAKTDPRSLRSEIVELDERVFDAEQQRPGQRAVARRASDIRRHPKTHISCELPVDVDIAARQVEHVVAVTVLQLGVVLHVRKHADSNNRVVRFGRGGGRRRRCLRARSTNRQQQQRERDHDAFSHTNVICKTARFPVNHQRVKTVLMTGRDPVGRRF